MNQQLTRGTRHDVPAIFDWTPGASVNGSSFYVATTFGVED